MQFSQIIVAAMAFIGVVTPFAAAQFYKCMYSLDPSHYNMRQIWGDSTRHPSSCFLFPRTLSLRVAFH